MTGPIEGFVRAYAARRPVRLHMPGHKGAGELEQYDITEIPGADSLYEASGVIAESEAATSRLFGAHTLYSTEGSSLGIRAMLALIVRYARGRGERPTVLMGRNAHRTALGAAALLDIDVRFLSGEARSYLSCPLTAEDVDAALRACTPRPTAVYLTSPDYLGAVADVGAIGRVCHAHGVLLAVDNAHGAYLRFLSPSRHPITEGADMCCDSAHKTLPALTGCAYLHIAEGAPACLHEEARGAMALFASTSPSYLQLLSLDRLAVCLSGTLPAEIRALAARVTEARARLVAHGFELFGDEPLKLTLLPRAYGYTGDEVAAYLAERNMVVEFSDPDALVMMLTPSNGEEALACVCEALCALPRRCPLAGDTPHPVPPSPILSLREAYLSPAERIATSDALGRVVADLTVACPPAVPIALPGERLTEAHLGAMAYYGVKTVRVIRD